MARLSIRVDLGVPGRLGPDGRLGPGKVALLERIAECGSISAAGRAMNMSYKRAWDLVAEINAAFRQPLVAARMGGRHGGGAELTPLGAALVAHYRAIERQAEAAAAPHLRAIEEASAPGSS